MENDAKKVCSATGALTLSLPREFTVLLPVDPGLGMQDGMLAVFAPPG